MARYDEGKLTIRPDSRDLLNGKLYVLDEVKALSTIPGLDMTPLPVLVEYFEHTPEHVLRTYHNYEWEIRKKGVATLSWGECKSKLPIFEKNGKIFYRVGKNRSIEVEVKDLVLLSKPAVLRFAMVLLHSRVAKQIRAKLDLIITNFVNNAGPDDPATANNIYETLGRTIVSGSKEEYILANQAVLDACNIRIAQLEKENEGCKEELERYSKIVTSVQRQHANLCWRLEEDKKLQAKMEATIERLKDQARVNETIHSISAKLCTDFDSLRESVRKLPIQ